jgi:hypothetical protein
VMNHPIFGQHFIGSVVWPSLWITCWTGALNLLRFQPMDLTMPTISRLARPFPPCRAAGEGHNLRQVSIVTSRSSTPMPRPSVGQSRTVNQYGTRAGHIFEQ